MEVNVPESDRELLRELAARLRAGGTMAERARKEMRSILNPFTGLDLKELIESMPLEELELERSREIGRDIELSD